MAANSLAVGLLISAILRQRHSVPWGFLTMPVLNWIPCIALPTIGAIFHFSPRSRPS